jgi:hypothetical protein
MRPEDLSECLLTHGFYYGDDDIGMGQRITLRCARECRS